MADAGRQYAGRSPEDRRADRRARLLAAGLELVGEEGAAGLSVRGVCARANLTPRYFYEEFGTLDEFARTLFDREFDEGLARVGMAVASAADDRFARVTAAVRAVLDVVTEVPARAALLLTEATGAGVLAQRRQARMEDVIAVVSAYARTSYGGDDAPPVDADGERAIRSAATFVAGGLAQTVDAWLRGAIPGSRDLLEAELAAQIVATGDAAFAQLERLRAGREPAA